MRLQAILWTVIVLLLLTVASHIPSVSRELSREFATLTHLLQIQAHPRHIAHRGHTQNQGIIVLSQVEKEGAHQPASLIQAAAVNYREKIFRNIIQPTASIRILDASVQLLL